MQRSIRPRAIIDKDGWRSVVIEQNFIVPQEVVDPQSYIAREKFMRYTNNHPLRIFRYMVGDTQYTVDCKSPSPMVSKWMKVKGAAQEDIDAAVDISNQFKALGGMMSGLTKHAFGTIGFKGVNILDVRAEDLMDLFGRLYSVEEVHRIVVQDWNLNIGITAVKSFYQRNLKEIERLRDKYSADTGDLSLTKKRARLDKLSTMFYTYYNKWAADERLDYSRELRAILEQIKKEVEGDHLVIDVQGQINVDLTVEVNKTLVEAYKRIPVNNLIVALVAAKRGLDPTRLMAQLTNSYYKHASGYGQFEPERQVVHPVDLTYNWNEISASHARKDKNVVGIEDAVIVTSAGDLEADAVQLTIKNKLLKMLEADRVRNTMRNSR